MFLELFRDFGIFDPTQAKGLLPISFLLLAFTVAADAGTHPVCLGDPPRLGRLHQPVPSPATSLTVTTLNLARATSFQRILGELRRRQLLQSDLFFFQEVEHYPDEGPSVIVRLARHLGYDYLIAAAQRVGRNGTHGLALLSRYPVQDPDIIHLPRFALKINNRCRIALTATVTTPLGAIGVVNVHLDTRINLRQRWRQFQPVVEAARKFPGASLIAGDFNTQNFLWVENIIPLPFLHHQVRPLLRRLKAVGYRTPFIHTGRTHAWAPLKLDWILLKQLTSQAHRVQKISFSDHRALWVQVLSKGGDGERAPEKAEKRNPAPQRIP